MKQFIIHNPNKLVFGQGSLKTFTNDFLQLNLKRLYILTLSVIEQQLAESINQLQKEGISIAINTTITGEPTLSDFEKVLQHARSFEADSMVGIGGGSVLDVAKLVAAQLYSTQRTEEVLGIGNLAERKTYLVCLPTTAGTGSEVSPNAIFVDDRDNSKKAAISPYLIPDAAYIDPQLTVSVPPNITASTGIDALTHCLEAYANCFAHPIADTIALKGIALISSHLEKAVHQGTNLEARTQVALGSMYGGMCLGPVNTAAIHALSYPLGTKFHIPHGLSNALLLPYVSEFNYTAAPQRYADIALAMGATQQDCIEATALAGIEKMRALIKKCNIPSRLSDLDIPQIAISEMAIAALKIQRLLKNNPREVTLADAEMIYKNAF